MALNCSSAAYARMVREESERIGIAPQLVLDNRRTQRACLVRWRAWRRLRDKGCSLIAIGLASGHDHTTVMSGLKRLPTLESRACEIVPYPQEPKLIDPWREVRA